MGFLEGKSCLTNLLETFEDWTTTLDEGYGLDVIYLHYKKAFDTVPHCTLIKMLEAYGIPCKVARWVEAFLSARTQRVVLNGSKSEYAPVLSGVPQGSVEWAPVLSGVPQGLVEWTPVLNGVPQGSVEWAFVLSGVPQGSVEWAPVHGPLS